MRIPIWYRAVSFYYYIKFRFFSKVKTNDLENQFLAKVAIKDKHSALVNLRFEVWLKTNKLKPGAIAKAKLRQAFSAGFAARGWHE